MQKGFLLLWILSVALSGFAWTYLKIVAAQHGNFLTRRRLTGCELARQILDRNQQNHTPVSLASEGGGGLVLSRKDYQGVRLWNLALALIRTGRWLAESKSLTPLSERVRGTQVFRISIFASWGLILIGSFLPDGHGVVTLGQIIFIFAFFLALTSLGREAEVNEWALANLAPLDGFEVGEQMRMKRLLKAIRWVSFAELFDVPFTPLNKVTRLCPTKI